MRIILCSCGDPGGEKVHRRGDGACDIPATGHHWHPCQLLGVFTEAQELPAAEQPCRWARRWWGSGRRLADSW